MKHEEDKPSSTRRALLIAGGTAAVGAAAVVAAPTAEAANGSALLIGKGNSATATTTLTDSSTTPALTVVNNGGGAAANFQAKHNTGFAGGTAAPNAYGLSAANTGATGSGAALAASGINNTGAIINTVGDLKYGLVVAHHGGPKSAANSSGGAYIDGGVRDGVVGLSAGAPADTAGVTGVAAFGSGVYGQGGLGVQGFSVDPLGAAVWAVSDGTSTSPGGVALYCEGINGATAIEAHGSSVFNGDITVTGTIFCNSPITPFTPKAPGVAAAKIQRRAGRTAIKLRPQP